MKMKKFLLTMLVGMMALGAMAQEGKFTVKGTFEHVGDSVQFFFVNLGRGEIRAVTGEMLEVTFDLEDANEISIGHWFTGRDLREEDDIVLPAIPGETLIVSQDENGELSLSGSLFYVDYNEALKTVEPVDLEGEEFVKELREKLAAGVPEEELMDYYMEKAPVLMQKLNDAVTGYVKAHPDQDAAAALIAKLPADLEFIEPAVALLTERARNSVAAHLFKKNLEEAQIKAEEDAKQHVLEDKMAPDFTLMDINGKPLSLSSLRGKWVILDFWARGASGASRVSPT